jgi:hypothetical protein
MPKTKTKTIKVGFVKATYKWLTGAYPQLEHVEDFEIRTVYKAFTGNSQEHIIENIKSWCMQIGALDCVSITREEFEEAHG